jgi:hypothetical protein
MRLDHISYVTSHEQLADTVQRIGSRLSGTFIDGGIHPRFGTRNFTMPLQNGLYLEIVCPLDHPASDASPFGKIVSQRAIEGGGWLTWVISTDDMVSIEKRLGRDSVEGHRTRPDGIDLKWKQIGILDTLNDSQMPFFIQWLTNEHPSINKSTLTRIDKIKISGSESKIRNWINCDLSEITNKVEIVWLNPENFNKETGIVSVTFTTPKGVVEID